MKFFFFHIPVMDPEPAGRELNRFLGTRRVIAVEKHLVNDGPRSGWAVCVTVADGPEAQAPPAGGGPPGRVDYKAVLPPEQFEVFARLRKLRKSMAEKEGVPPYAVFNNEQLARMVQEPVTTRAALARIPGVGPARVKKYGAAFLALLRPSESPPSAPSESPDAPA
ncbi:MAG: HRDC domain-containing protein [Alphaproteobacteria bacterium]|nr:HRDC domain-containing protein [Alphaproteobacteria bacterium]